MTTGGDVNDVRIPTYDTARVCTIVLDINVAFPNFIVFQYVIISTWIVLEIIRRLELFLEKMS